MKLKQFIIYFRPLDKATGHGFKERWESKLFTDEKITKLMRSFNQQGFTSDLKLTPDEVIILRELLTKHWLMQIKKLFPDAYEKCSNQPFNNYHSVSHLLDHSTLMKTEHRNLPEPMVCQIKEMQFFKTLEKILGLFTIEDVQGDSISWRISRPGEQKDVFPCHADEWYFVAQHGAADYKLEKCIPNSDNQFRQLRWSRGEQNFTIIHTWIAIDIELGLNGLLIAPKSHLLDWDYKVMGADTYKSSIRKFELSDDQKIDLKLAGMHPGDILLFHDKLIHGGALNKGNKTRVAMLFNIFIPNEEKAI